jgi:hypothetical protein
MAICSAKVIEAASASPQKWKGRERSCAEPMRDFKPSFRRDFRQATPLLDIAAVSQKEAEAE